MDERLVSLAAKPSPSVGWIPAGTTPEKVHAYFESRRSYYAELGIRDVGIFPLHDSYDATKLPWLLGRDIIHLSGGDPYLFLRNLRATGVLKELRKWALAGGILVGDSGGAMMITRTLGIAAFDGKPVPDDMRDSSALGLVNFEVHPHFGCYGGSPDDVQSYASKLNVTVYGLRDGTALSSINGKVEMHGAIDCYKPV